MEFQELQARMGGIVWGELQPVASRVFRDEARFWSVLFVVAMALQTDPDETWGRFNQLLGAEGEEIV